jgi:hypothetical protein
VAADETLDARKRCCSVSRALILSFNVANVALLTEPARLLSPLR